MSQSQAHSLSTSATALSELSRRLYQSGPLLLRKMMHYRIQICPFERLLEFVPENTSVLDVGCGSGLFLALLGGTRSHFDAVGFDSSKPAIKLAQAMLAEMKQLNPNANIRIEWRDVGQQWPQGPFGLVSLIDVLHHVPVQAQKSVITQAINSLQPGGLLLYKDMANKPFLPAALNRLHDLVLARQWIQYLPISDVDTWASQQGLTLLHAEFAQRLWYCHEIRVFRKPLAD